MFEIAKIAGGYAGTPITLANFNGTDGIGPFAGLVADAAGDLFGTTQQGGAYRYGTVFEIAKTDGSYASTPTTLINFNYANGADPNAGLIADAAGDLFGTTYEGGANYLGTVFELSGAGFFPVNPLPPAATTADMILRDGANVNYEIQRPHPPHPPSQ